jgi:hypothetical protein
MTQCVSNGMVVLKAPSLSVSEPLPDTYFGPIGCRTRIAAGGAIEPCTAVEIRK